MTPLSSVPHGEADPVDPPTELIRFPVSGMTCSSCVNRITIGRDVTFGDNVYVADNEHSYGDITRHVMKQPLVVGSVTIGDNVWVGKNSVIFGNVTIGNNAIIGANSVWSRDVPPLTIVAGSPARAVKRYDHDASRWVGIKP